MRYLKLGVGAGAITWFLLLTGQGCRGARTPSGADLAAGVEFGAAVVHVVDVACADTSKALLAAGKTQAAADLAGTCKTPLRDAADALQAAALSIDAADAGSTGDAACAIVSSASAVGKLMPILTRHGVTFGAKVGKYLEFADLFSGVCHVSQ